jgi:pimeloyl-ACP methyl ester carboxylesterase
LITRLRTAVLVVTLAVASTASTFSASQGATAGRRVAVGGRSLYLVCAGVPRAKWPTVVLVSGYHDSSDPWIDAADLSLLPQAAGPPVFPGLARTVRVCAYDRPGTLRYTTGLPLTNRSTRVRQPRTVRDLAGELHALLAAAHVPAPYLLVGHSLGGLVALFYARTYPSNVGGVVFVDAFSPTLPAKLGDLWPLYREVLNPPAARQPIASLKDSASETVDIDASVLQVRSAPALRRMPLIVLTKTEPFRIPPDSLPPGITAPQIDRAYVEAQDDLVNLAPSTPHVFATGSEHYIQLSQPDLVIEAVQLVIRRAMSF